MTLRIPDENFLNPLAPNKKEQEVARKSLAKLAIALKNKKTEFLFNVEEGAVAIPQSAAKMLLEILSQMANGNAVVLIPAHAELTTQEAADAINVSRPFLVKLLESNKIPYRKVGSHRRVMFEDLMKYKEKLKADRLDILEELQKDAQDKNMGY